MLLKAVQPAEKFLRTTLEEIILTFSQSDLMPALKIFISDTRYQDSGLQQVKGDHSKQLSSPPPQPPNLQWKPSLQEAYM